jgi:hypothetical protein
MKFKSMLIALSLLVLASLNSLEAQQRRGAGSETANAGAQVIKVTITEQGFEPNVLRIDAQPGAKLTIKIENRSKRLHGLRLKIGTEEYGPQDPVQPGKVVMYEMTMPKQGGLGSFYSPVGDDRARGFKGRAIVGGEAPGGML